ncbi:D-aspartate oxidase-like [Anopheles ziemanni]|uniref:D-aspartate oxidase-like n=1 Tax=Anopheles coustani TaxID=139045 RepID=UPI0026588F78|nr:D-aspartate oxidase-like [Anopheles coustani]XP_058169901.1 D-aspartate oxidase-like [Anopheles ziemanni]
MKQQLSANMKQPQFVILGGGIIGLSCAVRLSEKYPDASLHIIGEHFSPHTTSDVAAGLWGPYALGNTPETTCRKWAKDTHTYMHQLWRSGHAEKCGLCLVPVVELFTAEEETTPWWHNIVFGFQTHHLQPEHAELLGHKLGQNMYRTAISYVTFTCEPTRIMSHYRKILSARNAQFRTERLESLRCLTRLNINSNAIIINCLGLGAQSVVGDTDLGPIRGQVQKVKAEGVFHSFANDECYIIPNTDTVTLGGTKQKSTRTRPCPVDRYMIRTNCTAIVPSLREARLLKDAVGLRPVRSTGVRVEMENVYLFDGEMDDASLLVHNYGHGGAGITLAWGCAGEVVHLVERELGSTVESKL